MTKLLSAIGIGVTLLGVFALMIVLAPSVKGQTVRSRPFMELKSNIFGGIGLGLTVRDVDEADVKREKLAGLAGAVVEDVQTDGPAAKAGLKAGDVIVTFDGEKVRSAKHLARLVEETPEGREVDATVIRAGEKVALKATPANTGFFTRLDSLRNRHLDLTSPDRFNFVMPKIDVRPGLFERFADYRFGWNGVTVQDLTGQLGDYFGTRDGVLVTNVEDGSAARTLGLKAGDVITKIDDYAIRSSTDWWRRMSNAGRDVTITLMRDRKELTLKGKIE
jgi:serine protease Do